MTEEKTNSRKEYKKEKKTESEMGKESLENKENSGNYPKTNQNSLMDNSEKSKVTERIAHKVEEIKDKKSEMEKEKTKDKKVDEKKESQDEKKAQKGKKDNKLGVKKYEAIARGVSVHMSKKQGTYICSFIKNKPIDQAIKELNEVILYKRAIPFKGEIPHRKGKGMMSGRYPIAASKHFITLLKGLKGNVIVNGLDLDKTRIYIASTSWASRPARRGGMLAKRSNVIFKAKEFSGVKK